MRRQKGKWFGLKDVILSSVRNKLIALFLFCFLVPLAIMSAIAYAFTAGATRNDTLNVNINMLSHIGSNVNYLVDDVHGATLSVLINPDVQRLLKNNFDSAQERLFTYEQAKQALVNMTVYDKNIDSVEVIGADGIDLSVSRYYSSETLPYDENAADIRNLFDDGDWTREGQLGYYIGANNQITLLRTIRDTNDLQKELGMVAVHLRAHTLSAVYMDRAFNENTQTYIIDNRGLILSASNAERIGGQFDAALLAQMVQEPAGQYLEVKAPSQRSHLFYEKLGTANWYVICEVLTADLTSDNGRSIIIILTTLLCALGSILIVTTYLKRLLAPLDEISRLMKEVEKENYAISVQLDSNDEIGHLAHSFNQMTSRLSELINLVYSFEIRQRDAQIALLRSQINPHFLYNVMDIIYWKSRSENANATAGIVRDLSLYLRKSITDISTYHSVRDELDHLYAYVNLQRHRYEGRIEFDFAVDEALLDKKTIPFVLQPLVENAIYHGVEQNGGVGHVGVCVRSEGGILVMEVSDDGQEPDLAELSHLIASPGENNRGLAVHNINDRVRLLYGEGFGLCYERTEDELTVARVTQKLADLWAGNDSPEGLLPPQE